MIFTLYISSIYVKIQFSQIKRILVLAFNPSTQDAEAGGSLCEFEASLGLQREFQDSKNIYIEKACFGKPK